MGLLGLVGLVGLVGLISDGSRGFCESSEFGGSCESEWSQRRQNKKIYIHIYDE